MMPGGMFGWGFGGLGLFFMLVFWAAIIVGIVLGVRWLVQQGRPAGVAGAGSDSALDILKKRYAQGEIDREEFEAKRRDLS